MSEVTTTTSADEIHQLHFSDAVVDLIMDTGGDISIRVTGDADFSLDSWKRITSFVDRNVRAWRDADDE